MRPERFTDVDEAIDARKDALARQAAAETIIACKKDAIDAAWEAMPKLGGRSKEDVRARQSQERSSLIILEKRENDEIGSFFILGSLDIEYKGLGSSDEKSEATFRIGVGFEAKPDVSVAGEHVLGESQDGRKWYGRWGRQESTADTDEEVATIFDQPGMRNVIAVRDTGLGKLRSFSQSVEAMIEAIQDKQLNPVAETATVA